MIFWVTIYTDRDKGGGWFVPPAFASELIAKGLVRIDGSDMFLSEI